MNFKSFLTVSATAAVAATASGQTIYDNTANVVLEGDPRAGGLHPAWVDQGGEVYLSRLTVAGGGTLQTATFTAAFPESGPLSGPTITDATLFLYSESGAVPTTPDDGGDGVIDETLLFSSVYTLPAIAEGQAILHTVDISSAGVNVAAGDTLWLGVSFAPTAFGDFGQVLYQFPGVGSTSGDAWSPSLGSFNNGADTNYGAALTVPAPSAFALLAMGPLVANRRRRR